LASQSRKDAPTLPDGVPSIPSLLLHNPLVFIGIPLRAINIALNKHYTFCGSAAL